MSYFRTVIIGFWRCTGLRSSSTLKTLRQIGLNVQHSSKSLKLNESYRFDRRYRAEFKLIRDPFHQMRCGPFQSTTTSSACFVSSFLETNEARGDLEVINLYTNIDWPFPNNGSLNRSKLIDTLRISFCFVIHRQRTFFRNTVPSLALTWHPWTC